MTAPLPTALLDARFLQRLEALSLVARRLATGSERGERTSHNAGSGIAFATHRPYVAGDDFRFVDWKLFARSERLFVKQFEEERDLTLHILLDCSASMAHGSGAKFRRAQELAAALGYIALVNLDRVALYPYATDVSARLPTVRGKNRALLLLRQLEQLAAEGGTDLARAARTAAQASTRGGVALVVTDGFEPDGFLRGIDLLRYRRFEVIALLVVDPRDAEPEAEGETTFVDRESGETRTIVLTERVRTTFRAAYEEHFQGLARVLSERGVRSLRVDVQLPLERVVLDLLRQSGVVR